MFKKIITSFTVFAFGLTSVVSQTSWAQVSPFSAQKNLPAVGTMVSVTDDYDPVLMRGLKLIPEQPFRFDFLMETGQSGLDQSNVKDEALKLIRYFYASLTTPEKDMWVNLSPYEKDRIIPDGFGLTEMGRDLLAQDYILKQLTSSLMHPEKESGKAFWEKVYEAAYQASGTAEIPVETFHKVWILPDKAVVYAEDDQVYVVKSSLKVMLEEDYLAQEQSVGADSRPPSIKRAHSSAPLQDDVKSIIREIIIPIIEREVNDGKNFAPLRQIYHSLILAQWFKNHLKKSVLGQLYVDQNKVSGINLDDTGAKQAIYEKYLESFKSGVYDLIKEEYDPATQSVVPRKYFSGGMELLDVPLEETGTFFEVEAAIGGHFDGAMLIVTADGSPVDANGQQLSDNASLSPKIFERFRNSFPKTVASFAYWKSHNAMSFGFLAFEVIALTAYGVSALYAAPVIFFVVPSIVALWKAPPEYSWLLPREQSQITYGARPAVVSATKKDQFPWTGSTPGWVSELFKYGDNDAPVQNILKSKATRGIAVKTGANLEQLAVIAALNQLIDDLEGDKSRRMREVVKQLKVWRDMVDNDANRRNIFNPRKAVMVFDAKAAGVDGQEEFVSAFVRKDGLNVPRLYILEDVLRNSIDDILSAVSARDLERIMTDAAADYFSANAGKRIRLDRKSKFFEFFAKQQILKEIPNLPLMEILLQGALESVGAENSKAGAERILDALWMLPASASRRSLEALGKTFSLDHLLESNKSKIEVFTNFYRQSFSGVKNVRTFLKEYEPEIVPVGLPVMDQLQEKFHSLKGVLVRSGDDFVIVSPDVAWKRLADNLQRGEGAPFARVLQFKEGSFADIAVIEFYNDRSSPLRDQILWKYDNNKGISFLKSISSGIERKKEKLLRSLESYSLFASSARTMKAFENDLQSYGYRVYDLTEKKFVSRQDIHRKLKFLYQSGRLYRSDEHKIFVFESGDPMVQSASVSAVDVMEDSDLEVAPAASKATSKAVRGVSAGQASQKLMEELKGSDVFKEFKSRVERLQNVFQDKKLSRDNKTLYDEILSFKQYIISLQNYKISDPDLTPIERVFLQTLLVEKGSSVSLVRFNNLIGDVFTIEPYLWDWFQNIKMDTKLADEFVYLADHWTGLINAVEEADAPKVKVIKRKSYQMLDLNLILGQEDAWGQNLSGSEVLKYLYNKLDSMIDDLREVRDIKGENIDGLLTSVMNLPQTLQRYMEKSRVLTPAERRIIKQLLRYKQNISLNQAGDLARSFFNSRHGKGAPSYNEEESFNQMIQILVNIYNGQLLPLFSNPDFSGDLIEEAETPGAAAESVAAVEETAQPTSASSSVTQPVTGLVAGPAAKADDGSLVTSDAVGGINLDPTKIQFEEQGRGMNLMTPQDMKLINKGLEGITPVIINIRPVSAAQIMSQLDAGQKDWPDRNHDESIKETAILLERQS